MWSVFIPSFVVCTLALIATGCLFILDKLGSPVALKDRLFQRSLRALIIVFLIGFVVPAFVWCMSLFIAKVSIGSLSGNEYNILIDIMRTLTSSLQLVAVTCGAMSFRFPVQESEKNYSQKNGGDLPLITSDDWQGSREGFISNRVLVEPIFHKRRD